MIEAQVHRSVPIPRRVIAALAIGFPALYMANSFTPWSVGLFVHHHRSAYVPFWTSVLVLHWATVLVCVALMRHYGWRAADVRLALSRGRMVRGLLVLLGAGLVLGQVARFVDVPSFFLTDLTRHWQMYPSTTFEYLFWPFVAVTAGVCEEFVYRGFLATAIERRGVKARTALVLASIVWIGLHGLAGIFFFPVYLVVGLILTAVVLRRGRLGDSIVFHAVMDALVAFR